MNLSNFLNLLPRELKDEYHKEIIKEGKASQNTWDKISSYFEENFKEFNNVEEETKKVLEEVDSEEREKLLQIIKENNEALFKSISNNIFSFEDIVTINTEIVKKALEKFSKIEIIKSTKAASPAVTDCLQNIFTEVDFNTEKADLGMIPISEIANIQALMVKEINDCLNCMRG